MKTYKTKLQEVVSVETVTCNKCGKKQDVHTNDADCVTVNHTFGYNSNPKLFGDMTTVNFDLCERCVFDLINTFVIPANVIHPFLREDND